MAIPIRIRNTKSPNAKLLPNLSTVKKRDWRLWAGIGFILLAVLLTSNFLSRAGTRVGAVVLTHDVAAGSTLSLSDIQSVQVNLPNHQNFFDDVDAVLGLKATRDLFAGDLLQRNAASANIGEAMRTISVPIRAGHLPNVQHGSLVDVWMTPSTQGLALPGPPTVVAKRAVIDGVPDGVDPNSDTAVTITIPASTVPVFMTALRDGNIDLAVVPQSDGS